jgi:hypothetical protein
MWNISANDVQQARERLEHRRTEIEARYAEEKQALETELAVIETLERAASEFALRHSQEDAGTEAEPAAGIDPTEGGEEGGERDIFKPGSRWRLYRGARPTDAEGTASSASPTTW